MVPTAAPFSATPCGSTSVYSQTHTHTQLSKTRDGGVLSKSDVLEHDIDEIHLFVATHDPGVMEEVMEWLMAVLSLLFGTDGESSSCNSGVGSVTGRFLSCLELAITAYFPTRPSPPAVSHGPLPCGEASRSGSTATSRCSRSAREVAKMLLGWLTAETPMVLRHLLQQPHVVHLFALSLPLVLAPSAATAFRWEPLRAAPATAAAGPAAAFVCSGLWAYLSRKAGGGAPAMPRNHVVLASTELIEIFLEAVKQALAFLVLWEPAAEGTESSANSLLSPSTSRATKRPRGGSAREGSVLAALTTVADLLDATERSVAGGAFLSSGCDDIDVALGGSGWCCGQVSEVYGEAGTGKTQLLLQSVLTAAAGQLCDEWVYDAILGACRECCRESPNQRVTDASLLDILLTAAGKYRDSKETKQTGSRRRMPSSLHRVFTALKCSLPFWSSGTTGATCDPSRKADVTEAVRFGGGALSPPRAVYIVSEDLPVRRLRDIALGVFKKQLGIRFSELCEIERRSSSLQLSALVRGVRHFLSSAVHHLTLASDRSGVDSRMPQDVAPPAGLHQRGTKVTAIVNKVLSRVLIRRVHTLSDLHDLFTSEALHHLFAGCVGKGGHAAGGIVAIDSIAEAVAASRDIANGSESGRRLAGGGSGKFGVDSFLITATGTDLGVRMRRLAIEKNAVVLVANQARAPVTFLGAAGSGGGGRGAGDPRPTVGSRGGHSFVDVIPALGLQWLMTAHVRVKLTRHHQRSIHGPSGSDGGRSPASLRRQCLVMYSPYSGPAQCFYRISTDGVLGEEEPTHESDATVGYREVLELLRERLAVVE